MECYYTSRKIYQHIFRITIIIGKEMTSSSNFMMQSFRVIQWETIVTKVQSNVNGDEVRV